VQKNKNRSSGRNRNNNKLNTRSWIERYGVSVFTGSVIKTIPPSSFICFCVLETLPKPTPSAKEQEQKHWKEQKQQQTKHTKLGKTLWWECFLQET